MGRDSVMKELFGIVLIICGIVIFIITLYFLIAGLIEAIRSNRRKY